jgi:hypothetical protein
MYEKEMQGYVTMNQKIVADGGKMLMPKSRSQIWFNNQMIRMLPYMPWKVAILKEIRKPYDAITLKHYESVLLQARAYVNCCIRWLSRESDESRSCRPREAFLKKLGTARACGAFGS